MAERAEADKTGNLMTDVMSLLATVVGRSAKPEHESFMGMFKPMLKEAADLVQAVGAYKFGTAIQKVEHAYSQLQPVAKGGSNGQSWHGGKVYDDEAEMLLDAEESLGNFKEEVFDQLLSAMTQAHAELAEVATKFDCVLDSKLEEKYSEVVVEAKLTKATGAIFYAIVAQAGNPVKMKRTIRSAADLLDSVNCYDRLPAILRAKILPHVKRRGST